jgi:RimJ/RimL family protein N-acetyltransferase
MLSFRPATMEDARRLFDWRNHPTTRAVSNSTDKLLWEGHLAWLEKSVVDRNRRLFVVEAGETPVGTVRADRRDDGWLISWTVAPESRGLGYGKTMVARLVESLDGNIYAEIRIDNRASQSVARHAGLTPIDDGLDLQLWRKMR